VLSSMIAQKSLKISEEKEREGKNPSRDASVMLLRHFRDRFRESFFVILRRSSSFIEHQPVIF